MSDWSKKLDLIQVTVSQKDKKGRRVCKHLLNKPVGNMKSTPHPTTSLSATQHTEHSPSTSRRISHLLDFDIDA